MPDVAVAAPAVVAPAAPAAPAPAATPAEKAVKIDALPGAKEAQAAKDTKNAAAGAPKDAKNAKADAKVADAVVKQLHKLIVDGKEEEVDVDELIRRAQLSSAADKRFKEASESKKDAQTKHAQVAQLLKMIDEDPSRFAKEMKEFSKGKFDPEKFATALLTPIVQEQIAAEEEKAMTPEQRKQRAIENELKEYKAKEAEQKAAEKRAEDDKKASEHKAKVEQHRNEFAQAIQQALEKTKLPKSPMLAIEMDNLLQETLEKGLPAKPEHLARELESRKRAEFGALAKDGASWLPKEVQDAIRKTAVDDPALAKAIQKKAVEEFKKGNPLVDTKPTVRKGGEPKDDEKPKKASLNSTMRDLMRDGMRRG